MQLTMTEKETMMLSKAGHSGGKIVLEVNGQWTTPRAHIHSAFCSRSLIATVFLAALAS